MWVAFLGSQKSQNFTKEQIDELVKGGTQWEAGQHPPEECTTVGRLARTRRWNLGMYRLLLSLELQIISFLSRTSMTLVVLKAWRTGVREVGLTKRFIRTSRSLRSKGG